MAKPQSKTQKRIDNNIRQALTSVCEQALKDVPHFQWLTHQVDYTNFPASLFITCVFDTDDHLAQARERLYTQQIQKQLQAKLFTVGVKLASPINQVRFDTEQACEREIAGNWKIRLASLKGRALAKNRPAGQ